MKKNELNKIRRESLGLTQAQLAEKVGISAATVSKHENGELISDIYYKAINNTLKKLEMDMTKDQYAEYRMTVGVKIVLIEKEPEQKMVRLHDLLHEVSKSIFELEISTGKRIMK